MALPLMMRAVIVPTYRARDLRLLAGASDDRLPSRAPDSPHLAADSERATLTDESLYQIDDQKQDYRSQADIGGGV
jgi:hypothetical protein